MSRVGTGMDLDLFFVFLHRPIRISFTLIEEPQVVMGIGDARSHLQSLEELFLGPFEQLFF
jgi:hypothetical protein